MKEVLFIFFLFILIRCKNQTPDFAPIGYAFDSTLSDKNGVIKDSSRFHLPADSLLFITREYTKIDSFGLKFYSSNYKCFKAPILYNYYLGSETYRFLWSRSFHRPVLITVKKGKKIILNTKELERHPKYAIEIFPDGIIPTDPYEWGIGYYGNDIEKVKKEFPGAAIVKPKYDTKITLDSSIVLTKNQWDEFQLLLKECSFWTMNSSEVFRPVADGAIWILEGHTKEKYHFVKRWSPEDKFGKCCEYLIKLSAAKNEEIY
jgi:hypothetical protein